MSVNAELPGQHCVALLQMLLQMYLVGYQAASKLQMGGRSPSTAKLVGWELQRFCPIHFSLSMGKSKLR